MPDYQEREETLNKIKRFVKASGLKPVVVSLLNSYLKLQSTIRPVRVCERNGVKFRIDLRETIDTSIYLGGWERDTLRFVDREVAAADVVIEVGANIGAHTLPLSKRVGAAGQVHAFEPTTFARDKLLANIALNSAFSGNVKVSSQPVTNKQHAMPRTEIESSWRKDRKPHSENINSVPITLDEYAASAKLDRLSLLKIDVDGYDYKVLQGAADLIKKFKPVIFIELCEYTLRAQGDSVTDIFSFLTALGYASYYDDGRAIQDVGAVLRQIGTETSINGVFRPVIHAGERVVL